MPGGLAEVEPLKAAELPLRLELGPRVAPGPRGASACVPGKGQADTRLEGRVG